MASGQQRAEKDSGEKQGMTSVPVHRGARTSGDHLGAKGLEESKGYDSYEKGCGGVQLQSKKEQEETQGRQDMGARRDPGDGGKPSVDEGIDVDESTGWQI